MKSNITLVLWEKDYKEIVDKVKCPAFSNPTSINYEDLKVVLKWKDVEWHDDMKQIKDNYDYCYMRVSEKLEENLYECNCFDLSIIDIKSIVNE